MYQSHVYLEVRILVSGKKHVFPRPMDGKNLQLDDELAAKVQSLSRALECTVPFSVRLEQITGTMSVPPEYDAAPYSLKTAENGHLPISFHAREKNIRIEEIRLEEDAGRLTHSGNVKRMDYTYAGCASLRLKTSADFELGEEAEIFLNELRRLIQYLQISPDIPLDKAVRCNAYAALSKYPDMPSYYVKLRNLNSFNFARKAINAELSRQEEILSSGGKVESESRLWNEKQNFTESYKTRSEGELRHFISVEPAVSAELPAVLAEETVELPEVRRKRLCREYGLSRLRAEFICDEKDRADFFEASVKAGANPMDAAHWLSSDVTKILKRKGSAVSESQISPENFAYILKLFSGGRIHSGIAKQLLQAVIETGADPDTLIRRHHWKQISSDEELLPILRETIQEYPAESAKLRAGEMAPLEFLTGIVMKKTNGLAVPQNVKILLKRELDIQIVFILSMGGAICGRRRRDGSVSAADDSVIKSLLEKSLKGVQYQVVPVGALLSEEIEPADWAKLIAETAAKISAGTATGIVVAHGTDTLPYTAALLFWLFSDADVPIVLTASSATPEESEEAQRNLLKAAKLACAEKTGVYVVYDEQIFSPLNLKFLRPVPGSSFVNWNLKKPVFTNSGPVALQFSLQSEFDPFVVREVLREAADSMMICKIYPGFNASCYSALVDKGIRRFFLELYDTGTGSMRSGDYSLKPLLLRGKKNGCKFYCTSQQESSIDFSGYATSRRVWREGAVPMGMLTTESAAALYYAVSLAADSAEELDQLMEQYAELYSAASSASVTGSALS